MNQQQYGVVEKRVCIGDSGGKHSLRNTLGGLKFLLHPTWKYGKMFIISSLILSVIQPLSAVVTIIFQRRVIDSISEKDALPDIVRTVILFGVLMILLPVIDNLWSDLYREKKQTQIIALINKEIYQKSLRTDFRYFDDPDFFNNYTWAISQYSSQAEAAYDILLSLVTALSGVTALTVVIAESDVMILLFTVITLFVSSRIKLQISRLTYQKLNERIEHERKKDYVQRTMYQKEYIPGLKSTKASEILIGKYNEAVDRILSVVQRYMKKQCFLDNTQEIINNGLYIGIVGYLGWRIISGRLTIGGFTAMLTASTMLKSYLSKFIDVVNQSQQAVIFAGKIRTFFDLGSVIEDELDRGIPVLEGAMDVELRNVWFSYPNSGFALKNINMKIRKGSKIAIVGENGTGKTTFTKLLLRLYDPHKGEILINDVPLKDYKVKELRSEIGIAFQEAPLYAFSVEENMSVYSAADSTEIKRIFETFGLDNVLEKSHSDLSSEITREFDKNGLILSGGEKQKMLLARLFTKDFGLLILDEPTSALDPLAEYELNKLIFSKASTTTTIMVSHRLSAVRDADCIYLFKDGTVYEQGTHDELMEMHGMYYDMFTKQAEKYTDQPAKTA